MTTHVTAFLTRRWRVPASAVDVEMQSLEGGLESAVARARITSAPAGSGIPGELVVKQLCGAAAREADVYQALWKHLDRPPAVQMLGRHIRGEATYLFLEHAISVSPWPWSDPALAARVCREVAQLHDSRRLPREAFSWNYEEALVRSAEETLGIAAAARDASGRRVWRRLGDLRRIVAALPRIRRRLLAGEATVIHGDVHPGNVILRPAAAGVDVLLIDWARARVGSPFEDIASWLHSLGCWEPQARRRHDTLMRAYLDARRDPRPFDSDARADYWFASASNGLSGAIRYHLAVAADPAATAAARDSAGQALAAWERVVRRASALVNTSLDR